MIITGLTAAKVALTSITHRFCIGSRLFSTVVTHILINAIAYITYVACVSYATNCILNTSCRRISFIHICKCIFCFLRLSTTRNICTHLRLISANTEITLAYIRSTCLSESFSRPSDIVLTGSESVLAAFRSIHYSGSLVRLSISRRLNLCSILRLQATSRLKRRLSCSARYRFSGISVSKCLSTSSIIHIHAV